MTGGSHVGKNIFKNFKHTAQPHSLNLNAEDLQIQRLRAFCIYNIIKALTPGTLASPWPWTGCSWVTDNILSIKPHFCLLFPAGGLWPSMSDHSICYCCSVAQSCPVMSNSLQPMDCSTPVLPVHHQLPEPAQTHVHLVSDAIQPSHPLLSPSSPAFNLSQHRYFAMSQFFTSGGQSIGASASVLPVSIQDWFPSGLIFVMSYMSAVMTSWDTHVPFLFGLCGHVVIIECVCSVLPLFIVSDIYYLFSLTLSFKLYPF